MLACCQTCSTLKMLLAGDDSQMDLPSRTRNLQNIPRNNKNPPTWGFLVDPLQDLKCLVFSLISAHFKIQPISR